MSTITAEGKMTAPAKLMMIPTQHYFRPRDLKAPDRWRTLFVNNISNYWHSLSDQRWPRIGRGGLPACLRHHGGLDPTYEWTSWFWDQDPRDHPLSNTSWLVKYRSKLKSFKSCKICKMSERICKLLSRIWLGIRTNIL